MTLYDDRLEVVDFRWYELASLNRSPEGLFDTAGDRWVAVNEPDPVPFTITFWGTDRITSSGPPTRTMALWLARALFD